MKHSISARQVIMGTAGLAVLSALSGCQNNKQEESATQAENQNKFIVVEQLSDGKYVVVEEMPTTGPSRALIRSKDENGTTSERVMSEAEMKTLADQEYKKMKEGKSELNSEPRSEGMGLGGTILAAAGGALLGNMIGNALMNNTNFRKNQDASNRSAYHRSANQSGSKASSGSPKKSFFGNLGSKSSSSSSSFGG
ncbi:MAG: hypothetical protein PHV62_04955 [Sulfuricurvum sp.]|nr:hypothetical protein [Sulfuricurvum sp.]